MRLLILLLLMPICSLAQQPEIDSEIGKKAFDDLVGHYNGTAPLSIGEIMTNYASSKSEINKPAADYIYALFVQSYADEFNGRDVYIDSPFFGEGSKSQAREFRSALGDAFATANHSNRGYKIIEWLIFEELLPANQANGVTSLQNLKTEKGDELFVKLIENPSQNFDILMGTIDAVKERNLEAAIPGLIKLSGHHRVAVREKIEEVAKEMDFKDKLLDFNPMDAVTPWMDSILIQTNEMVMQYVAEDVMWVQLDHTHPEYTRSNETYTESYIGWLIGGTDSTYIILDYSGQEVELMQDYCEMKRPTLGETIKDRIKLLESEERLSPFGRSMLNSHEGVTALPDFTLTAWGYASDFKKEAIDLFFLMLNSYRDDRWYELMARDYFGHLYHNEMLHAYSFDLDYETALTYAEHLSKPYFEEYNYQPRAVMLKEQLIKYKDIDFKTVTLPTPEEWARYKTKNDRSAWINFLAERIRLLQCIQPGQPGGISYHDQQFKPGAGIWTRWSEDASSEEVINPYVELLEMDLTIKELPYLVPYMEEELYIPSFSYWRDFSSDRTLHKVNWVIADIMQQVVVFDLADMSGYYGKDEAGKKEHLEGIIKWCEDNAHVTNFELIGNTIRTVEDWYDLQYAMKRCVRAGYADHSVDLAKRIPDFAESRRDVIYETLYKLQSKDVYEVMRKGMYNTESTDRLWCGLYIMQFGESENNKGLEVLTEILSKDDGEFLYPKAFSYLLYLDTPESYALAEGILETPTFAEGESLWYYQQTFIRKLIIAKSDKALKYVMNGLISSEKNDYGEFRYVEFLEMVAGWRMDDYEYDREWPDKKKKDEAKEMVNWLSENFNLNKEGKPHQINDEFGEDQLPVSFIDSP